MWRGKGGRDKRQKEKDSVTERERDRVGERREGGRGKNVEGRDMDIIFLSPAISLNSIQYVVIFSKTR